MDVNNEKPMKNLCLFLVLLMQLTLISGCGKHQIDRVSSPDPEVFLTVETSYALGPATSDFTKIYAHLEAKGRSDKELILDGQYLDKTKFVWESPSELTVCIADGGFTESFRNYITLRAGGISETIHSRLQERCK